MARITPAVAAEVIATPCSMKIENRKFPKNDIGSSVRHSARAGSLRAAPAGDAAPAERPAGGSSQGRAQGSIASAAMPNRSQASRNTGSAAVSGRDSAT